MSRLSRLFNFPIQASETCWNRTIFRAAAMSGRGPAASASDCQTLSQSHAGGCGRCGRLGDPDVVENEGRRISGLLRRYVSKFTMVWPRKYGVNHYIINNSEDNCFNHQKWFKNIACVQPILWKIANLPRWTRRTYLSKIVGFYQPKREFKHQSIGSLLMNPGYWMN